MLFRSQHLETNGEGLSSGAEVGLLHLFPRGAISDIAVRVVQKLEHLKAGALRIELADTFLDAAGKVRGKEISSRELTRTLLERISRLNPKINAYITVLEDGAMKEAAARVRISTSA